MSFNWLPLLQEESIKELPSLNQIVNNTLLLIQTNRNLPTNSFPCLDNHDLHQPINQLEENSIEHSLELKKQVENSVSQTQKKKPGCTCKKTKCLKRYCDCFQNGRHCTSQCSCYGCFNIHEYQKFIDKSRECLKGKGSRKNGKGCICKRSQCRKKYCQCFNMGVPCTDLCRCINCGNQGEEEERQKQIDRITSSVNISKLIYDQLD